MGSSPVFTQSIGGAQNVTVEITCKDYESKPKILVHTDMETYKGIFNSYLGSKYRKDYYTNINNPVITFIFVSETGSFQAKIIGDVENLTMCNDYVLLNYDIIKYLNNGIFRYVTDHLEYIYLSKCKLDIAEEGKQ